MLIDLFARSLLLGLAIAAPVGPVGVLCIRRTLAFGKRIGFVSGLGAATADGAYGALAAFGLTAITSLLLGAQVWLRLIGGALLLFLGWRTLTARPPDSAAAAPTSETLTPRVAYLSTLGITITNPATIISFIALFASLGTNYARNPGLAGIMVLGVFCGSALWWLILSTVVGAIREQLNRGALRWVNRLSGAILLTFGIIALVSGVMALL